MIDYTNDTNNTYSYNCYNMNEYNNNNNNYYYCYNDTTVAAATTTTQSTQYPYQEEQQQQPPQFVVTSPTGFEPQDYPTPTATMNQPIPPPPPPLPMALTPDAVYCYMLELFQTNYPEYEKLLSALNMIGSNGPLPFKTEEVVEAEATSSSSPTVLEMSDGCMYVSNNNSNSTTAKKCSGGASSASSSSSSSSCARKTTKERGDIAKKYCVGGCCPNDGKKEHYFCKECKTERKSNTFASEGHYHHEGVKPKIRWFCPVCQKDWAVTYRTTHLAHDHGIIKLGKVSK